MDRASFHYWTVLSFKTHKIVRGDGGGKELPFEINESVKVSEGKRRTVKNFKKKKHTHITINK